MKLLTLVLLVFTTASFAWEPDRTSAGYTSNTGTRYQYNMYNFGNRIRYQLDTVAQKRNQTYGKNTAVQIDKMIGQRGTAVKFP